MQCSFIKPDGAQCNANATEGSTLCFTHNPDCEEKRKLAVTNGGLNRRHYEVFGEPFKVENAENIKQILGEVINGIWTGKIPSNQPANTIGFLCRCWLDAQEKSDFEKRLRTIEDNLNK